MGDLARIVPATCNTSSSIHYVGIRRDHQVSLALATRAGLFRPGSGGISRMAPECRREFAWVGVPNRLRDVDDPSVCAQNRLGALHAPVR